MKIFIGLCLSIGIGTALIGWSYISGGFLPAGLALALFGLLWLVLQSKWPWVATVGLFVFTLSAAGGIILDLSTPAMFASASCALLAWDLGEFHHRQKQAAKEDNTGSLARSHFARLGIVLAVGMAAALFALTNKIEFNFEWAALLLVAGALGVGVLVTKLKNND